MFIRLLIFIILGIVLYRAVKGRTGHRPERGGPLSGRAPMAVDDEMVQDPVCGSYFPVRDAVTMESNGRTILFCSPECRDQYAKEHADQP